MSKEKRISLGEKFPQLIPLWSDRNNKSIFEVYPSSVKYWWNCNESHNLFSNYYKRLENNCGVCSGHIVEKRSNDFETICKKENRVDLLKEWDYEENSKVGVYPDMFTAKSNKIVKWKCSLNHKWPAQIGSRWNRKCPGCSRKRLEVGFNDLRTWCTNHGELTHLIEQWDTIKNLEIGHEITKVTCRARIRVWWRCSNNHSWLALISNRTAGDGCPECKESKLEKEILEYLKGLDLFTVKDRNILNGLEIDAYIQKLGIGFEINGDFWHSNKWVKKTKNMTAYQFHKSKKDLAESKGVRLYFIWESDWLKRNEEVKKEIQKVLIGDKSSLKLMNQLQKG